MGDFDIIIVNYRTYEGLEKAIGSLARWEQECIDRILVIDNDPDDGAIHSLSRRFSHPIIEWMPQGKNLGFSKAVNMGLKKSRAEYVMLLNPDAYMASPLLAGARAVFQQDPAIAVIGPRVLNKDGTIQGSARWDPSPITGLFGRTGPFTRLFPNSRLVKRDVVLDHHSDTPKEVHWVSGACMMVRRGAIDDVGAMDERFFIYWEDCDWCKRFRQKGYRVVYAPGIGTVVHACGEASRKRSIFSLFHFHRSAFLLYAKYDNSPARIGTLLAFVGCSLRFLLFGAARVLMDRNHG